MSSSSSSSEVISSSQSSAGSFSRGIRLRRFSQTHYVVGSVDGYRFRVVAYGAYDMPNEIFLFRRRTYNPDTAEEADEFTSICSPADLEEYPVDAPTGTPPFFRASEIDLVFRSSSIADDAWDIIKADVESLVRTLGYMDVLDTTEDETYGSPPDADPPT